MEGIAIRAIDFVGPVPIIQAAVFIAVLCGIYAAGPRGQRDNTVKPDAILQWVLIGPMHDMMGRSTMWRRRPAAPTICCGRSRTGRAICCGNSRTPGRRSS